jgi:hypothetical protein
VTVVSHLPAENITVAVLSSGDADLRLLTSCSLKRRLKPTRPPGHPPVVI